MNNQQLWNFDVISKNLQVTKLLRNYRYLSIHHHDYGHVLGQMTLYEL